MSFRILYYRSNYDNMHININPILRCLILFFVSIQCMSMFKLSICMVRTYLYNVHITVNACFWWKLTSPIQKDKSGDKTRLYVNGTHLSSSSFVVLFILYPLKYVCTVVHVYSVRKAKKQITKRMSKKT